MNDLISMMSDNNNYQSYRDALRAAKGACIPYLGVHLQDLSFLEKGNADFMKHNNYMLINWVKRELIYDVISEIQKLQTDWSDIRNDCPQYNFVPIHQLQILLKQMEGKAMIQQELMEMSLNAEPPVSQPQQFGQSFSHQSRIQLQLQMQMPDDDDA